MSTAVGVTAETLSSISTPDVVESRLGRLEFRDGAPSQERAALLYENLDFMHGVEASSQRLSRRLGRGDPLGLYGYVFLKSFSRRGLKSVGSFAAPGTSILMAWVDAASPLTDDVLDAYNTSGSRRLVLNFNSREQCVVIDAV